jgi:hypothetical protein
LHQNNVCVNLRLCNHLVVGYSFGCRLSSRICAIALLQVKLASQQPIRQALDIHRRSTALSPQTPYRSTVQCRKLQRISVARKKAKAVPLYATGASVERRYSSYSFFTWALDGVEWSASRPCRALAPGKGPPLQYPLYKRLAGP